MVITTEVATMIMMVTMVAKVPDDCNLTVMAMAMEMAIKIDRDG